MPRYVVSCVIAVLFANAATATRLKSSHVTTTCGGRITQPTTITVSHTQQNPAFFNCFWTIEAGTDVKLLFKPNYVNFNTDCNNNFLKIFNGLLINNDNLVATICGNSKSRVIIPASENTMTVHFSSRIPGNDFSAKVYFADSETIGCGGEIHMRNNLPFTFVPPPTIVYGREMINCIWNIWAPKNMTVSVKFMTVDLPVCTNKAYELDSYYQHDYSRNRMWPTTCDSTCGCNFLEVWDGAVPDSYKLGSYCGQCAPPDVVSSSDSISVWLSTTPSLGAVTFSLRVSVEREPTCQPTKVAVSHNPTHLQSPGYPSNLTRGTNCVYEFQSNSPVLLTIKNLDIQPGTTTDVCDKDKIVIEKRSTLNSLGMNYIIRNEVLDSSTQTKRYEYCGSRDKIELKIEGSFYMNLITTLDDVSHKGLEFDVVLA